MASTPVFITQYEVLRSQDYVLITLSAPSGDVVDGRMQTQEVQRIALTLPRFLELAGMLSSMAANITAQTMTRAPASLRKAGGSFESDETEQKPAPVGDWVIRH